MVYKVMSLNGSKNYFENRQQIVKVNNDMSSKLPLNVGVSQGSVLSPLLFLIFINDLPTCVQKYSTNLFADDSMSYTNETSKIDIQNDLQFDVNNVSKWFKDNKLTANVHKCGSMMIGTRQILGSDLNLGVKIYNEPYVI